MTVLVIVIIVLVCCGTICCHIKPIKVAPQSVIEFGITQSSIELVHKINQNDQDVV